MHDGPARCSAVFRKVGRQRARDLVFRISAVPTRDVRYGTLASDAIDATRRPSSAPDQARLLDSHLACSDRGKPGGAAPRDRPDGPALTRSARYVATAARATRMAFDIRTWGRSPCSQSRYATARQTPRRT